MLPDIGPALQATIRAAVDAIVARFGESFDGVAMVLSAPVRGAEWLLGLLAPELAIVVIGLAAWRGTGRPAFGVAMAGVALGLALLGVWSSAIASLALVLVAIMVVLLIGVPLGVFAADRPRLAAALRAVYDVMQTTPTFVYLIPVAMLLGLGRAPALIATVIYALPPLARLTELGLREVDGRLVETARALGLSRRQTLWLVMLPIARPTILEGLNQSLMLALGMVVVASMIGAKGLGEVVLLGLQRADPGLGVVGGLAIVLLAILLDRMMRAVARR